MKQTSKIYSLDILRGLAALLVYCCHGNIGEQIMKATGIDQFKILDIIGGKYAVPVFFILSGYCIELAVKNMIDKSTEFNVWQFYQRRVKRLYVPYLAALLFSIVVEYVSNPDFNLSINDFISHLFMLHGLTVKYFGTINIVFWTLTIELAFYLLYPLYYYLKQKFNIKKTLIVISVMSCVSTYFFAIKGIVHARDLFFPTNLFISWCLGCALQDAMNSKKKLFNIIIYYLCCGAPLLILLLMQPNAEKIISYNFIIMGAGLLLLLFLKLEHKINASKLITKLITAIGVSSYSLYLFHQPLINLKVYAANFITNQPIRYLTHLIWIPAVIVICYFIYVYFEKPFVLTKKTKK